MSEEEIIDKLKELVVKELDIDAEKITLESTFEEDLEADSLDIVELLIEIEETFGVSILDEDAENLKTVNDVVQYLKNRI